MKNKNDKAGFMTEKNKKELWDKGLGPQAISSRQLALTRIDHLLFEALAEKENGKPEKMKAYLALRAKLKKEIPK